MDWARQSEEMMKQWSAAQKQWWNSVMEVTESAGGGMQMNEMWEKTVEAWEKSVDQSMAAQQEWFTAWLDQMEGSEALPEEMEQWIAQGREMAQQWQQTSHKMWREWFDLAREANVTGWGRAMQEEGQSAMETWREMTRQAMNAQMNVMKMWVPGVEKQEK